MSLQDFAISLGLRPQRLSWWKSEFADKHKARTPPTRTRWPGAVGEEPRFVPVIVQERKGPRRLMCK